MNYNRKKAYEYAKKWAYSRNPKYYDFNNIGGDCTNFISQCLYAGGLEMNYKENFGWYYINGNNKAPAWTGVEFFYNFIIKNNEIGPKGIECKLDELQIGDVIQLSFDGMIFAHSLIVIQNGTNPENTLIATHTFDAFGKKVSEYDYLSIRCIHIIN